MDLPVDSVAERLAAQVAALAPERIPSEVRATCEALLIDVGGLCVAARASDYVRALLAAVDPGGACTAIAATTAVSAALGLPRRALVDALGVAGSMAGGIIEYLAEGAWTKRLHAGWAAQIGVRAARIGREGFVGPRTVLEGTHGLFFGF